MTPPPDKPLRDKVAIVTGASRGIGEAIARRLAREGAHCVIAARDDDALRDVARRIEAAGGTAHAEALDLRDPESQTRLVGAALADYARIDIVVNNAGATARGEFLTLTEAQWTDGFSLKFFGSVRLCRASWPYLQRSRGSIVNIAGIGGRTPGSSFAIGGSVNAALLSFTKSLADSGIAAGVQVNAINPGAVRTDRLKKRLEALASEQAVDLTTAEHSFVHGSGIQRIGEPDDIAGLVAFIVGPEGRFLHGSLIDMDGGATKSL